MYTSLHRKYYAHYDNDIHTYLLTYILFTLFKMYKRTRVVNMSHPGHTIGLRVWDIVFPKLLVAPLLSGWV